MDTQLGAGPPKKSDNALTKRSAFARVGATNKSKSFVARGRA
jgi:hypothetical protein